MNKYLWWILFWKSHARNEISTRPLLVRLFSSRYFTMDPQWVIREPFVESSWVKWRWKSYQRLFFVWIIDFSIDLARISNLRYSFRWIASWCSILRSNLPVAISSSIRQKRWCLECERFSCSPSSSIEYNALYATSFEHTMCTANGWHCWAEVRRRVLNDTWYTEMTFFLSVNIEYSVDYGKHWNHLLQPCFLGSTCSHDVQHVYSSKLILPTA